MSLAVLCAVGAVGCSTSMPGETMERAAGMGVVDRHTLRGRHHLVRDYPPIDVSGNINVVVEIPTGTNAKWEVDKTTGDLKWEFERGRPRMVSYLAYPGNYGMIPRTLLPKETGGDGDPLDVLVLGPALPRGSVVKARAIGMLRMLDDGEQDDKIIAVSLESGLGGVSSMGELRRNFHGAAEIIEIWFLNYKGPDEMVSRGFAGVAEARAVIRAAIEAYRRDVAEAR